MNWYKKTRSEAMKHFKHYKLFLALLAATSPRKALQTNLGMAKALYKAVLINPGLYKFSSYIFKNEFGLMPCHIPNVRTIIAHWAKNKPMKTLVLSGNKVNAYYQNLLGNEYEVTLDMYMIKYFNHSKPSLSKSDYKYYSKAIRKLARKKGLSPAQIQADIWIKERDLTSFNQHGYKF